MLEIRDLDAAYGDIRVLTGVTLSVGPGEIVALLGPNGAGKSTLLNSIAGLLRPRAGAIRFEGEDLNGVHAHLIVERGVALVPEGRRLFGGMTVEENLELGAFAPRARAARRQSLARVLALFPDLGARRRQVVRGLSGGQQQMVAVGRALMSNPRLLMCDELSLGLAPSVIKDIYVCLAQITAQGTTVIIVEQDIDRALSASQRFYCLQEGKLALTAPTANFDRSAITAAYFGL